MKKQIPNSIKIKIFYDSNLREITGKHFEETVISEGLDFIHLLYFIFSSYPEIEERFPPGRIKLLLNGKAPKTFDILKNGDEVRLEGISDLSWYYRGN